MGRFSPDRGGPLRPEKVLLGLFSDQALETVLGLNRGVALRDLLGFPGDISVSFTTRDL